MKKCYLTSTIKSASSKVRILGQSFGYQIFMHQIPDIWQETQGEGVTIAVLDTGCQVDHVDLVGSFRQPTSDVTDRDSHGTHVSGIITANNNDTGIVGVAPQVEVIVKKVLNDEGWGTEAMIVQGMREAIDEGADIISMSLGAPVDLPDLHNIIIEAYNKGIAVICAAGNSGDIGMLDFPGRYAETISVGALDSNNLRAEFSQTGNRLDFMAPGVAINSTIPINSYASYSGTSMATPWMSGVVALIISKHRKSGGGTPVDNVEQIREHLKRTAIDLEDVGKDDTTGFGLVDVGQAIAALEPEPVEEPAEEPEPVFDLDPFAVFENMSENIQKIQMVINGRKANIMGIEDNKVTFELVEDVRLKVSGIQANPEGRDRDNLADEWIEFENANDQAADLSNFIVQDRAGNTYTIPEGFVVEGGVKFKVRTGVGTDTETDLYWGRLSPVWNNKGDEIKVKSAEGMTIVNQFYS
tara:strand:+ start:2925 stop:4331 length:1407 start_codon:yes stop_codon:yes gene_type:complete